MRNYLSSASVRIHASEAAAEETKLGTGTLSLASTLHWSGGEHSHRNSAYLSLHWSSYGVLPAIGLTGLTL
jgi:hypothetical protein